MFFVLVSKCESPTVLWHHRHHFFRSRRIQSVVCCGATIYYSVWNHRIGSMNLFLSLSLLLFYTAVLLPSFFFIHESSMRMWKRKKECLKRRERERKIGGSGEFTFQKIYAECMEKFFISGFEVCC